MNLKRLITLTATWFIIIGTISYTVAWITSLATGNTFVPSFITPMTINYGNGITSTLYKLDVISYLKSVETAMNIPIGNMYVSFPTFPNFNWANVGGSVVNIVIWLANYFIWWFNLILFIPLKIVLSLPMFTISVCGINLEKYGIISNIYYLYTLKPPLIPYV